MFKHLFITVIIFLNFIFSLESFSFENNKENIIINPDRSKSFIPYTLENINNGKLKGGHDTITSEGFLIKKEVHKADGMFEDFYNESLHSFRAGAHDEDTNWLLNFILRDPPIEGEWGNFFYHFFNPSTGRGFKGFFGSSLTQAKNYSNRIWQMVCGPKGANLSDKERRKVYYYFGRIMHLLQDMAVPSHTKDDIHVTIKDYERYVNNHWREIVNADSLKERVTANKYLERNFGVFNALNPDLLMARLANKTHAYPDEEELFDVFTDANGIPYPILNEERLKKNVEDLIPEAIHFTGAYINSVYDLMQGLSGSGYDCSKPPLPRNPAGDHPDDRFDVSDEFYWEQEFKVTEYDLLNLFLRTAIKKGKLGVWYKKLFLDKFFAAKALSHNASPEEKAAMEAEFQRWSKKLDERVNEAESDWKGAPDVALFTNGFYDPSISLLLKMGEPVSFLDLVFDPKIVQDHPVMLVPTGGFYGLEKSSLLKSLLDEYVKNGGTLIVFAQQHGADWQLLPVPEDPETGERKVVSGFGYQEDQSCSFNSVYIDTYHQVLSHFSTSTVSVGVDGYFTSYPENSTILLRRTANGQPAMILYPYGQGYVIATTLYTDFALTHGQANQGEINLIRNLISWAKKPALLSEIRPGESVNLDLNVTNLMDLEASGIKFTVLDINRKVVEERIQAISLAPGQSLQVSFSFNSAPSSILGIYHVDYSLLDQKGEVIQPQAEINSGRFVISNPAQTGSPDKPFWFFISTSSQEVLLGGALDYTFHIINNTDEARNLTIKNRFRHTNRERQWSVVADPKKETLISATDLFLDAFWMMETMEAVLSDETGNVIGKGELSFKGLWPSVKSSSAPDKNFYRRNEKVTMQALFKNDVPLSWEASVSTYVFNIYNQKVFEDTPRIVSFVPYESKAHTIEFTLPSSLPLGSYAIRTEVWFAGRPVSSSTSSFELAESRINITPILPSPLVLGENNFSFLLENVGKIDVTSGSLEVTLKDPEGKDIFSQIISFALSTGESKRLDLPISLSPLKFGIYSLIFKETDETKGNNILSGNISLPNTVILTAGFDKAYYRVREIARLSARIENRGQFLWDNGELNISLPEANYSTSSSITLTSGDSSLIQTDLILPANLSPGLHDVNVSLNLAGSSFIQKAQLAILPSSLEASYSAPEDLRAGDTINLTLENKGGVDTTADTRLTLGGDGGIIYQKNFSDFLPAGGSLNYAIPLSAQATDGSYSLFVEFLDRSTQKRGYFWQDLNIAGIKADLSLRSDKDLYFGGELVKALCQINNKEYSIGQGILNLKIMKPCMQAATSYHFYTFDGGSWIERGVLSFGSNFETKIIDLSEYLIPDESGVYKLRIRHIGEGSAQIDNLSLMSEGIFYAPTEAFVIFEGEEPYDILSAIAQVDGWAAEVLNEEIEIRWYGLPENSSKIILMSALEGQINWSCQQEIFWEKDIPITQGANMINDLSEEALGLYSSGNYLLQGILISSTGQTIAQAEYPFSVTNHGLGLRFTVANPVVKTGDTVRISGEIINGRHEDAPDIRLELCNSYGELLSHINFALIPAQSRVPFTFNLTTSEAGEKIFRIKLYQGDIWLMGDREKYEVVDPSISVIASAPEIVGHDPFSLNINLENTGKVPAALHLSIEGGALSDQQSLTLKPKEKKQITYLQSITSNTNYSLKISGDLNQEINIPVIYGEGVKIVLSAQAIYAEGQISIPVVIQNVGQVAEEVSITFQLKQGEKVIKEISKNYYLPQEAAQNDLLIFDLLEGDYQLIASSSLPFATSQAVFAVRKEEKVIMNLFADQQVEGIYPVKAELYNLGSNPIAGILRLSLQSQQHVFWSGEVIIPPLSPDSFQATFFNIDPAPIIPGAYTLKGEFLSAEGKVGAEKSIPLIIAGPSFTITQIPPFLTFSPGQEANFTFKVLNTGHQEGAFNFHFKSYDLIDLKRTEWLKPGEEKSLEFSFILPQDLEEKDYEANYELQSSGNTPIQGQIKYHLAGIKINVQAALDKTAYKEGEVAHLTLTILSDQNQNLFARVNYPNFEAKESFILQGSKVLTFDIPLPKITGDKLFYGIYQESGRAIHLNSLYIYKLDEKINLMTDKQVYKPGEQVLITLIGEEGISGNLTLSGPDFEETFPFSGTVNKSFSLPESMTAGTYYVSYNLLHGDEETLSGSRPFDVDGLQVKVKDASLEKDRYNPGEIINLTLKVESNHDLAAILKTWIIDPEKNHSPPQIQEVNLKKTEFSFLTSSTTLSTQKQGLHQLIYALYTTDGLLLCSGMEGFEVGAGIILSLSTDKVDYPSGNEPVIVNLNLFGQDPATLDLILNGQLKGSYPVTLTNFSNFQVPIYPEKPGLNTLQAVLTSEGLSSLKETSFTYGSSLPDLAVWINSAKIEDGYIKLSITVLNRGQSPSPPTILKLYDGPPPENLIASLDVKSLSLGEGQTFIYQLPISGRTGENTFIALINEEQAVSEFNNNNNKSKIILQIKAEETEGSFTISADQTSRKIEVGEEIEFNLTLNPLNGFAGDVHLAIKDCPPGFSASFSSNPVSLSESPALARLKLLPTGQVAGGSYHFTITAGASAQNQELPLELQVTDFGLIITPQAQTIKQLSEAIYTINLSPLHGFDNSVSLELTGLPDFAKASLSATEITSLSGTNLTIRTSKWLKPGVYNFTIAAYGKKIVHEEQGTLIIEQNPLLTPGIITAPTREKNPLIKSFLPDGTMINKFNLLLEKADLHLAAGDVDGDGLDELIIGADKKGKGPFPLVQIFMRDGTPVATLEGEGWYKLGAPVAAGDIDGDWIEEIAVGYYVMPAKEMEIYDDLEGEEIYSLCPDKKKGKRLIKIYKLIEREFIDTGLVLDPYLKEDFWGAPKVALGDIDGDGKLELITAPGPDPRAPAQIKAFQIDTSKGLGKWQIGKKILDLIIPFAKEKGKKKIKIEEGYGANIAAGDLDRDGQAEIILGPGPDPKKEEQIIIFYPGENKIVSFLAYPENQSGIKVASGDLDGDGKAEIITGPGHNPHRKGVVKIFKGDGSIINEFQPYPGEAKFGISVTFGQVGK